MLFRSGLLELLSSLGLVSKIVLLILLIFSIGSWTVILYKWRFFRPPEAAEPPLLKSYRPHPPPRPSLPGLPPARDRAAGRAFASGARCRHYSAWRRCA